MARRYQKSDRFCHLTESQANSELELLGLIEIVAEVLIDMRALKKEGKKSHVKEERMNIYLSSWYRKVNCETRCFWISSTSTKGQSASVRLEGGRISGICIKSMHWVRVCLVLLIKFLLHTSARQQKYVIINF